MDASKGGTKTSMCSYRRGPWVLITKYYVYIMYMCIYVYIYIRIRIIPNWWILSGRALKKCHLSSSFKANSNKTNLIPMQAADSHPIVPPQSHSFLSAQTAASSLSSWKVCVRKSKLKTPRNQTRSTFQELKLQQRISRTPSKRFLALKEKNLTVV